MAKATAHHRRGGLLQRPVGRRVDDVAREVLGDVLARRGPARPRSTTRMSRSVMIPGPCSVGVHHDGRADRALGHQARNRAQACGPGPTVRTIRLMPSLTCIASLSAPCSDAFQIRAIVRDTHSSCLYKHVLAVLATIASM